MTRKKEQFIWMVWFLLMVFLLIFLIQREAFLMFQFPQVWAFLALVVLASFFPIHYRNHTLTSFQWGTLAIFIYYGFSLEVFVTQIALLVVLVVSGLKRKELYRIPINSIIFLLTSIAAASVFYLVGGQVGEVFSLIRHGHALVLYAATFLFANHFFIFATRKYLFGIKKQHFIKGLWMEGTAAGILLPLVIILVVLYAEIGTLAILLSGIIFVGISIVFKVYNSTKRINHLLKKVTEFGYELSSSRSVDELMTKVRERLDEFLNWDHLYLYDVKDDHLSLIYMDQKDSAPVPLELKKGDHFSMKVLKTKELALAEERQQWLITGKELPLDLQSILAIPLKNRQDIKRVITIASKQKKGFLPHQIMVVEIIANMLSVAIETVQNLEKTKRESYHCPLTSLYNLRYFEEVLKETILENQEDTLSLILLDLDHFKRINDTYGHQSGNDVLCEVARRLVDVVPRDVTVARYGGEEFVLLLPKRNEAEAYEIGLALQEKLKGTPILIKSDLKSENQTKFVTVTASIGVASSELIDEHEDNMMDAFSLIRRADRAMYNGAKQKGRDRVATYSEVKNTKEAAT
ncbi:sensor domain-containing diguanylate cyclase [Halalkalibacter okhensis]|uniref:GGDEF domain-containing protein n=1 Tax=Halalkalibacter okhensis TaxID=333138 RepID=A0A0B0II47_9BACI|nr:sensor domain-containing diguanylate cyclase [Halalkalibacter okhensis]KHF40955.1 hypothetical protein LQ50_06085 [Halalkalibacter okhensis]